MGMATTTKRSKKTPIDWNVADRQKSLLKEKYGIVPDEVTDEGYFYGMKATFDLIDAIKRERKGELLSKRRN